jgi:hypothetical protein
MAYSIFNFISNHRLATGLSAVAGISTGFVANKFCSRSTAALVGTVFAGIVLWQMSREQNPTGRAFHAVKRPASSFSTLPTSPKPLAPQITPLPRAPASAPSSKRPVTTHVQGQSSSVEGCLNRMVQNNRMNRIAAERLKCKLQKSSPNQFISNINTAVGYKELTPEMASELLQAYKTDIGMA